MNKKYPRILVTGGAGFIGSFLVDKLVSEGHEVSIFDNLEPQVHRGGKKPKYLSKNARFIQGDVRDYDSFKKVLKSQDAVFHMASAVGVGQSNYEVKKYVDVNTSGTANLVDILINQKHSVKKVILPSSMTGLGEGNYKCKKCGVVRPPLRDHKTLKKSLWEPVCPKCTGTITPIPTDEEAKEYPNSIYAISKKDQQDMLLLYSSIYQFPAVVLRFFNVYGPRQSLSNPYTGVTAIFISRLKNNQRATIFEDGLQSRDFVSVHDVVEALLKSLNSKKSEGQMINIGSGFPTPIKEIAEILCNLLGKEGLIQLSGEYRKNDIRHCFADVSKAKELLGWSPKISLKDGMEELIKWSENETAVDLFSLAEKKLKDKGLTS